MKKELSDEEFIKKVEVWEEKVKRKEENLELIFESINFLLGQEGKKTRPKFF